MPKAGPKKLASKPPRRDNPLKKATFSDLVNSYQAERKAKAVEVKK